jgi:hypothetical protein
MLGLSSMYSGASLMRPRVAAIVVQSRVERALAHALQRNGALGAHQTHRDLAATHLEREEDRRLLRLDRRGAREVERERRLTHGGTRRDDDHLAGVQTVGQLVEPEKPVGMPVI